MKRLLLSVGLLFAICHFGFGQVDTVAVRMEVDSLKAMAKEYVVKNKPKDAISSIENAENQAKNLLGKDNSVYRGCVFYHARILMIFGYYKESSSYFTLSNQLYSEANEQIHSNYALGLSWLGWLYGEQGKFLEAKELIDQAISIYENKLGINNLDYAMALHNLGFVHHLEANYKLAEDYYIKGMEIRKKLAGETSAVYTNSLMGLGTLYNDLARFDKAEDCYLMANTIDIKSGKDKTMDHARLLNNLGRFYWSIGQLDRAEDYYIKSLDLKKTLIGEDHSSYAMTLANLGIIYSELGQIDRAILIYLKCKEIREKTIGKEHYDYAMSLNNLGSGYQQKGEYKIAEAYQLESKQIREKIFGKEHPHYVMSLTNLANLYRSMGRAKESLLLEEEGAILREKTEGKGHPYYAYSLTGLAKSYNALGMPEKSDSLYKEAKLLRERTLGKSHLDYLKIVDDLAMLTWSLNRPSDALKLLLENVEAHCELSINGMKYLNENELGQFIKTSQGFCDKYLSLVQLIQSNEPHYINPIWDECLFYKGAVLENVISLSKHIETSPVSVQEDYKIWKSYLTRLYRQYTNPIADRDSALIFELEEKANSLEKELTRTVAGFGDAFRQVTWQEVQSALKPDEAALEFIRFNYYTPEPTDSILYAALLLKPGMEAPAFLSLFEEKQLQAILAPLAGLGRDGPNELYAGQSGQSLYELLWKPLEPSLQGTKVIYVSPAGLLHRLNLSTIPVALNSTETIGKQYDMYIVGSTRQLAVSNPKPAANSTADAIIFGGIQYEIDSTNIVPVPSEDGQSRNRGISFDQTDSTLRGDTWRYLKYSEKEVTNIQSQLQKAGFQAEVYKGFAATEESFKQIGKDKPAPKIIHLSTHGFFFPDVKNQHKALRLGSEEPVFKISNNPMIRAGLILAGGNYAWKTGKALGNREDGILTAYEISQMNLSNTDLVVLSACETGLGQIEGNEGVYGLQRAFKIAGAKHLIMSLWQIPDFHTQALMTAFYHNMLTKKMPIREALEAAQEEMRLKRFEPFYWAGFVLVE